MPTSLVLEDERLIVKAHKKKTFRKILTKSRAKMKPSTSEDMDGEKNYRTTPRTTIPSFYQAFAGWGKRLVRGNVTIHRISCCFQVTSKARTTVGVI
jgi:hypothetical protein